MTDWIHPDSYRPQLHEAEAMQYDSPCPLHDRRERKQRVLTALDRALLWLGIAAVAAAFLWGVLGLAELVSATPQPAWHDEQPVAP